MKIFFFIVFFYIFGKIIEFRISSWNASVPTLHSLWIIESFKWIYFQLLNEFLIMIDILSKWTGIFFQMNGYIFLDRIFCIYNFNKNHGTRCLGLFVSKDEHTFMLQSTGKLVDFNISVEKGLSSPLELPLSSAHRFIEFYCHFTLSSLPTFIFSHLS